MEVGVGTAISKTFGFIAVARYYPQGATGGTKVYKKNVFLKSKDIDSILCAFAKHQLGLELKYSSFIYLFAELNIVWLFFRTKIQNNKSTFDTCS